MLHVMDLVHGFSSRYCAQAQLVRTAADNRGPLVMPVTPAIHDNIEQ